MKLGEKHTQYSLKDFCEKNEWNWEICEDIIGELENKNRRLIIKHPGKWFYEITADGIIFAEKQSIISKEHAKKHIQTRQIILSSLKRFREENGKHEEIYFKDLCEKKGIEDSLCSINLDVLIGLGYIESEATGCYQITDDGMKRA